MLNKENLLTQEGFNRVEEELNFLKVVKRNEVSEKIKVALSFGDISENSEYDEAKNEQADIEKRIMKLENIIKNAKIIDENEISSDHVSVGSKVTLKDLEDDEVNTFTIVGATESDPLENKISNESPVGSHLIDKRIGDIVEVVINSHTLRYEIIEISR